MTEHMINNGKNKISARIRLQPQGIASKTKLAMKTEILQKNKMDANTKISSIMMKQKIWYFVWIVFIKIYFSHKVSKYCTRIKTNKTWEIKGTAEHMKTILEIGHIKIPKLRTDTADQQTRRQDCLYIQYGTYATLTLECDNTLYNVISHTIFKYSMVNTL